MSFPGDGSVREIVQVWYDPCPGQLSGAPLVLKAGLSVSSGSLVSSNDSNWSRLMALGWLSHRVIYIYQPCRSSAGHRVSHARRISFRMTYSRHRMCCHVTALLSLSIHTSTPGTTHESGRLHMPWGQWIINTYAIFNICHKNFYHKEIGRE